MFSDDGKWETRTSNTQVPHRVIGHEIEHLFHLLLLLGALPRVQLPQPVQPCQLEQLLREEEAGDEVGLRRPEGEVGIMHVLHVGRAEHAVLLRGKVDEEGGRGHPAGGGV